VGCVIYTTLSPFLSMVKGDDEGTWRGRGYILSPHNHCGKKPHHCSIMPHTVAKYYTHMAQALQACKHGRFNWGASVIKAWGLWCNCNDINYMQVDIMCVIRTCDCMQSLFHFHTTICSVFRPGTCNRQTPHPLLVGVPFSLCTTRTK